MSHTRGSIRPSLIILLALIAFALAGALTASALPLERAPKPPDYLELPEGYTAVENPQPDWIYYADMEDPAKMSVGASGYYYEVNNMTSPNKFVREAGRGLGGSYGLSYLLTKTSSSSAYHMSVGRTYPTTSWCSTPAMLFPDIDFSELYYRFYVKQQEGWTGYGNNEKLLRFTSFTNNNAGTDPSAQPFAMHFWADNGPNNNQNLYADPMSGIDIRNGNNAGTTLRTTKWNDFDNMLWAETGGAKLACPKIFSQGADGNNGKWSCVETRIKLNDPGVRNGIFEVWVDGEQTFSYTGYNFIGGWDPGSTAQRVGINKIFLENYWNKTDLIPDAGQWRDFDNLVLSTRPIGVAEILPDGTLNKIGLRKAIAGEIGADFAKPVYRLSEGDYTTATWAAYKTALDSAISILDNDKANQTNIDVVASNISNKKAALVMAEIEVFEKAEDFLFADDFTGDLDAYFENRGSIADSAGYYGKDGFGSTIKRGNKAPGALTFAQNGNKAKTTGGAALALGFGKTPEGVINGADTAAVQSKVNIRFYTRSDEKWSTGSRDGQLARVASLTDATTSAMDIKANINCEDNKLTVSLPGGKSIKSRQAIFDRDRTGMWYCVEMAIDTDAKNFELFINGVSQGKVENINYPALTNGINALYLYNTVGELNIFDQNRYFDYLAITGGTYIGPVDVYRDGVLATPPPVETDPPEETETEEPDESTPPPETVAKTATPTAVVTATPTKAPATKTPPPSISTEPPCIFTLGDVNNDGRVNIEDILLVRDVIFGVKDLTPCGYSQLNLKEGDPLNISHILLIRDVIFF
ncbi:MAG: hypothetical protein FWD16_02630 [Clostridia bacterium]|nr:hypothetical protein [Clostridia bacterium]